MVGINYIISVILIIFVYDCDKIIKNSNVRKLMVAFQYIFYNNNEIIIKQEGD